jgi:peptidoglycan/LPS O-acetylase OafA/YrhL
MTQDFVPMPRLDADARPDVGSPRMEWPDALRGWAILGVVMIHCAQIFPDLGRHVRAFADSGQYGVQLFFIISALTICLTYGRDIEGRPTPFAATVGWYAKRFFRIAPLYYYGMAVYALIFHAMARLGSHIEIPDAWAYFFNVLFLHTWVPSAQNNVVPGGWSIGAEMVFYAVVPLIFLKLRHPLGLIAAFVGAIAFADGIGKSLAAPLDPDETDFLYYWFPTQLPVFLAGMILYRIFGERLWRERTVGRGLDRACCLAFVPLAALGLYLGNYGYWNTILSASVFGVAFCCLVVMAKGRLEAVLVNPLTVALGRISYSVYINHFIFVFMVRAVSKRTEVLAGLSPAVKLAGSFLWVAALSCVLSLATYRLIETPGIDFGRRVARMIRARAASG